MQRTDIHNFLNGLTSSISRNSNFDQVLSWQIFKLNFHLLGGANFNEIVFSVLSYCVSAWIKYKEIC